MINQVNNQSSICESLTDVTTHFELVLAGYVGELSGSRLKCAFKTRLIYLFCFIYLLSLYAYLSSEILG